MRRIYERNSRRSQCEYSMVILTNLYTYNHGFSQCGFSRAVIQMLEAEGADFKEVDTHNILADEIMREELKEYSDWPTFPQVNIFLGKCILERKQFFSYV